jgi:hypothetical protein
VLGSLAVHIKGCLAAAVDDSADHFRHTVVCRFGLNVLLQELGLRVKTLPGWLWAGGDDEFGVIFPSWRRRCNFLPCESLHELLQYDIRDSAAA